MLISKINRFIHRHGKLALVIIAAMVVIPFVFMWGSNSVFDTSSRRSRPSSAGTMFNEQIPLAELDRQISFSLLEYFLRRNQLIENLSTREGEVFMRNALQRMTLLHEARSRGLDKVTQTQVDERVAQLGMFQENGSFNRRRYENFKQVILPRLRLDEAAFRQFMKDKIIINRLIQTEVDNIHVSPLEVEARLRHQHERFQAAFRGFAGADFSEQVAQVFIDDPKVRNYYDNNRGSELPSGKVITELNEETKAAIREHLMTDIGREFYQENIAFLKPYLETTGKLDSALELYKMDFALEAYQRIYREATAQEAEKLPFTPAEAREQVDSYIRQIHIPPQKKIRAAVFNRADFLPEVEITEKDIKAAYRRSQDEYTPKVKASHILLRNQTDDRTKEETRELINKLKTRIDEGVEFAEIAREYSEDPGSADKGGELGTFSRKEMVKPFSDAAFELESGEISDIVETQFGFHLIKVEERIPGKEMEEVRDELEEKAKRLEAKNEALVAADDFGYQVFEKSGNAPLEKRAEVFSELAESKKVETFDSTFFNLNNLPEFFEGNRTAARKVYELSPKKPLSDVVEINGTFIVALYLDSKPAEIPEFIRGTKIEEKCVQWARTKKSKDLARQKAEKLYQELTAEQEEEVATEPLINEYDFEKTDLFTRASPPRNAEKYKQTIVEKLEDLQPHEFPPPIKTDDGALLLKIIERKDPDPEVVEKKKENIRQRIYSQKEQWKIQRFIEQLEEEADVDLIDNITSYLW